MKKDLLHKKVIINETKEKAIIIWFDEVQEHDSYLLEIIGKDEMPKFYKRKDFTILKNDDK